MTLKDELIGCVITELEIDDGVLYAVTTTSPDGKIYTISSAYDSNPALNVEETI